MDDRASTATNDVDLALAAPEEWPSLCRWHERGESPKSIAKRIDETIRGLEHSWSLANGWSLRDASGEFTVRYSIDAVESELIERELGFGAGFMCRLRTDREQPRTLRLSVIAGKHENEGSTNSAALGYDSELPADELPSVPEQIEILRVFADSWDPDYAYVPSSWVEAPIWKWRPKRVPVVGWLTYLPRRRGELPKLPAMARSVHTALGYIIIATPDRLSSTRPETLEAVEAVRAALETAGLLYPEPIRDGEFASQ